MNLKLLKALCEIPGVPGREHRVREFIEKQAKGLFDELRQDAMGSLLCLRRPTAPAGRSKQPTKVMIAAHMDEIGFFVRHVDDDGLLWVNPAGGFDARNLFSRRVLVCTADGDHRGVMNPSGKPVHISTPEDRKKVPELDEFFIDLGMSAEDVQKSVRVGDFVVMDEPFMEQPDKVVSKALDNRIACFVALETIRKLADRSGKTGQHRCEIHVVFTVQEEVGLRGATTAANAIGADIGIGLDTTLACDTPGVPTSLRVTRHGEGAGIMIQDSSMIADAELVEEFCRVAERKKIPHQRCILPRGGQDGAAIQRAGVGARTVALVCGTRYIHTVTESIDKKDLKAAIDLLAAWLSS
jgi:endoglucanase